MADYGVRYSFEFYSVDGDKFICDIEQRDYVGDVYLLNAASAPFNLKYTDNNETIYAAIKASEATINIIFEEGFDFSEIVSSDDTEFRIRFYYENANGFRNLLWVGFVDPDSCSEELVDAPKIMQIRATDGLGLLKKKKYQRIDGNDQYQFISVLNVITNCLVYTGVDDIDLNVEMSLFNEGQQDRNDSLLNEPLSQTWMHTRSFGKPRGEYDNCYNILNDILSAFNATLFQAGGRWNIVRFPDKWQSNYNYSSQYEKPWIGKYAVKQWQHLVNVNLTDVVPIGADHQRRFIGAAEKSVITYDYKIPDDLPRNKSMGQGDSFTPPSWLYDITTDDQLFYDVKYWQQQRGAMGSPDLFPSGCFFVRKELFDPGNLLVKETRFELWLEDANTTILHFVKSEPFRASKGDFLSFNIETSAGTAQTDSYTPMVAMPILFGDSGTTWVMSKLPGDENKAFWFPVDLSIYTDDSSLSYKYLGIFPTGVYVKYENGDAHAEWRTCKVENAVLPEDGDISIYFRNWFKRGSVMSGAFNVRYKGFSLTISPAVDNKRGVKGEQATMLQYATRRQNAEKDVSVGSAPRPYFNGALMLSDGKTLCSKWYTPNDVTKMRLSEIAAQDLYRARYRLKTKVEGTIKGIMYDDPNDTNVKVNISPYTEMRYANINGYSYLPTNLELNFEMNTARVYVYEFYHSTLDRPNEIGDGRTFKYIYE